MGLQVRVRHALGERLVDLPDRPVEHPLTVGRAREAELKIPSVSVASEHCALFVHNGQWVLQDMSGGATFINGSHLDGPTPLCVGDVIVLGTDTSPASIEIDPGGVAQGRSGHPAETHEPPPRDVKIAPRPAPQTQPVASAYGAAPMAVNAASRAAAMPYQAPPPAPAAWNAAPAEDDPFAGWQPAAGDSTASSTGSSRRRKKVSTNASAASIITICVICAVGLVFVIGIPMALYNRMHTPAVIVEKVELPPDAPPPSNNIFGIPDRGSVSPSEMPNPTIPAPHRMPPKDVSSDSVPNETSPTPAPKTDSTATPRTDSTPAPKTTDTTPPPAAETGHKDQAAWDSVRAAFGLTDIGQAVIKSEDYRRQHSSESFKDLDGMVDDAMDQLWWNRVSALCTQQAGINDQIKKKDKDIREETSAAFKKILEDEKKMLTDQLAEVQKHLSGEMSYTSTDSPQIDNKDVMQKLRDERDKDKFGSWKQSTLKYIKSHHGTMPWDG